MAKRLQIRLTDEQHEVLSKKAEAAGMSLSSFVLCCCETEATSTTPPAVIASKPKEKPKVKKPVVPKVIKTAKEAEAVWKPNSQLSKDYAVRGKGKKAQ